MGGAVLTSFARFLAWLAGAALVVGLGISVSFLSFHQIGEAAAARAHAATVLRDGHRLLINWMDAEAARLDYLQNGDPTRLAPYLAVRDTLPQALASLGTRALDPLARQQLATVAPLLEASLAASERALVRRDAGQFPATPHLVTDAQDQRLAAAIRAGMDGFLQREERVLAQREAALEHTMNRLFNSIVAASLLTALLALAFAYFLHQQMRQRLRNLVHEETRHLLAAQEASNQQLRDTNASLQVSEEKFAVTLNSIGDAVIATDAQARVTLLNPLAQQLTGWTLAQAAGRPVSEVFHIVNKATRQHATVPVMDTLAHGTVQGLANHTVLIARDGTESDIADSCAPIRDSHAQVVGAVLVFRNVTAEYAAQQALRDSAALIQTILNTVVDGIVTLQARGGLVEKVNPAAERMFGYTAAELAGQSFSLLIPELDQDQRAGSLAYYSASDAARAVGLGREVTGRRKDGSRFPMEIAVSEMSLGGQRYFTGILRDISARKQAEDALLKAGALQTAIFNSANFSSIATDARGVIQIFNVGAERMLGYAAGDVINQITPAEISDPQELILRARALSAELGTQIEPGFEALVFKASRGIEDIYALTYIRKDGSHLPAVVSVTALRDDGDAIIGYLLIGTDNTARLHVEAERTQLYEALQAQNTELESARATAESASKAKTDFLSSMSHELRTPLNAILGFAQLMESGSPAPTPVQKRNLDQILKAGWYLLELINEILDLALIESGKATLSTEPVALGEVMQECRSMIEPQAHQRGLAMRFTPFEARWFINADRTRVKQVLINLLFNAIKYNRPGGEVAVECTLSRPDTLRVSIRDTGVGMTPEQLGQLFQPFNRLGREAGNEEGTGIGLVVTRRLVEMMGGTLGVESRVGVGSVFWIELRLTTAPQLHAGDAGPDPEAECQAPDGAPLRTLLYVEDNPANLELVEQLIARRRDLRLLSAADAHLGIEYARAYQPALILMDINLPGISGLDAMKILHADPATAHIPIIALSANAVPRDIERALEAGFFNYLTKPIKVPQFMEALDLALKSAAPAPPAPASPVTKDTP